MLWEQQRDLSSALQADLSPYPKEGMAVHQPCRQLSGDKATVAPYLPGAVVKSRCEADPLRSLLQTPTLTSCREVG